MAKEHTVILPEAQYKSNLNSYDILLADLCLLREIQSLHLDWHKLNLKIQDLEALMTLDPKAGDQGKDKSQAIIHLINKLREIDDILDKYHCEKSNLIQMLLDIQTKLHWLPQPILMLVSERIKVPLAQIYSIVNFYNEFSLVPRGRHIIRVCLGTTCHVQGASNLLDTVKQALGINPGETTPDQKFTLQTVNCLGCCALGPVMMVDDQFHGHLTSSMLIREILGECD